MKRFFRNIPWKNVLIIALVVVLGVGAVAGIASIAKNETKTISSTVFKRGAIDLNGNYVESKTSIYTKDLIECQGLEIVPDFEATGNYQVFFYDVNKLFIGSTEIIDAHNGGVYTKGEDFPYAKYCRVVITPENEKDDYGNTIEDWEIKFYEVAGIANKFDITVNKKQKNIGEENLFDLCNVEIGCTYQCNNDGFSARENRVGTNAITLNLSNIRCNIVELSYDIGPGTYSYLFINETNRVISSGVLNSETLSYNLTIPEDAKLLVINYGDHAVPAIYRVS